MVSIMAGSLGGCVQPNWTRFLNISSLFTFRARSWTVFSSGSGSVEPEPSYAHLNPLALVLWGGGGPSFLFNFFHIDIRNKKGCTANNFQVWVAARSFDYNA